LNRSEEKEFQLAMYYGEVKVRGTVRLWPKPAAPILN
jgi:hypothetical protein